MHFFGCCCCWRMNVEKKNRKFIWQNIFCSRAPSARWEFSITQQECRQRKQRTNNAHTWWILCVLGISQGSLCWPKRKKKKVRIYVRCAIFNATCRVCVCVWLVRCHLKRNALHTIWKRCAKRRKLLMKYRTWRTSLPLHNAQPAQSAQRICSNEWITFFTEQPWCRCCYYGYVRAFGGKKMASKSQTKFCMFLFRPRRGLSLSHLFFLFLFLPGYEHKNIVQQSLPKYFYDFLRFVLGILNEAAPYGRHRHSLSREPKKSGAANGRRMPREKSKM